MKYSTSPTPSLLGYAASRSTSPLPAPNVYRSDCLSLSATSKTYGYLRRLIKFDQMDFEFAMWQMIYLFISPQKVYRNFNYRKQTKAQFARDDPAFLVLLIVALCLTSIAFAYALRLSIGQSIFFLFYCVFVDCILAGIVTATILWLLANRYMRTSQTDADIEWGYSFDVHLNAFFPPLILLHCVQIIFFQIITRHTMFLSTFVGNTCWLAAFTYYFYITFLGYNCIPQLKNVRVILAALPIVLLTYIVTLIIRWNLCDALISFYQYRVL